MIRIIRDFFARKNAAVSIATLLEFQSSIGSFQGNPYQYSQDIVNRCWYQNIETFNPLPGVRANTVTVVAVTLAWAISHTELKDRNMDALLICLKTAIDESRRRRNKEVDLDINLVNMCEGVRMKTMGLMNKSS